MSTGSAAVIRAGEIVFGTGRQTSPTNDDEVFARANSWRYFQRLVAYTATRSRRFIYGADATNPLFRPRSRNQSDIRSDRCLLLHRVRRNASAVTLGSESTRMSARQHFRQLIQMGIARDVVSVRTGESRPVETYARTLYLRDKIDTRQGRCISIYRIYPWKSHRSSAARRPGGLRSLDEGP